jgi:hypothetical protein
MSSLSKQEASMAVKPTPTQDENDRAAMGEHVVDKEPDGSELEASVPPPAEEPKRKQMEAKPGTPSAGYQTRTVAPAPTPAKPPSQD